MKAGSKTFVGNGIDDEAMAGYQFVKVFADFADHVFPKPFFIHGENINRGCKIGVVAEGLIAWAEMAVIQLTNSAVASYL